MSTYPEGAIFDEVQRIPHLLSYVQVQVDESNQKRMFILTGSHQAEFPSAVSQSLAGCTSLLRLLPLNIKEIRAAKINDLLDEIILKGGYPRIYAEDLPITNAYSSYLQTYIEKDVRQLLQVKDIMQFERFINLVASRKLLRVNALNRLDSKSFSFRYMLWFTINNRRIPFLCLLYKALELN